VPLAIIGVGLMLPSETLAFVLPPSIQKSPTHFVMQPLLERKGFGVSASNPSQKDKKGGRSRSSSGKDVNTGIVKEMTKKMEALEAKGLAEKKFLEEEIAALQGTISKLEVSQDEELKTARDELKAATDKASLISADRDSLSADKDALSADKVTLSTEKEKLSAEIAALEGKVMMIENESNDVIKSLKDELGDMQASLSTSEETAKSEAAALAKEIKRLELSAGASESGLRLSESKLAIAMDTITSLKAKAEEQTEQARLSVESVKKSLSDGFRKEREALEERLAAGMAELAALRVEYDGKLESKDAEVR
jgi:chromosome segregation ATPase